MPMKRLWLVLAVFLLCALGAFFFLAPPVAERILNRALHSPPYPASKAARALHKKLLIVDLHADSLLWGRDLLEQGGRGEADVPRLIEGNVALEVFAVVTKTPRGLNIERNDDRTDSILYLALAQRWPVGTWRSLTARALYQAERLDQMALRSQGRFVLIRNSADLAPYLERRQREPAVTSGILGIEGAHALDGSLDNLDRLFAAGYRIMSLTHFFDNEWAGSSAGLGKGGLTKAGRELVRRMEARHMLIDLAHASPRTIRDVLAIAQWPVIVSHTGVKGVCNNARNLSDEELRGIARTGGVIGIGFWETAACGKDAASIVHSIRYVADRVGVDHVALGSDFDGAVATPFDAAGMVQITDALLATGFTVADIEKIMGGNALRVLEQSLP